MGVSRVLPSPRLNSAGRLHSGAGMGAGRGERALAGIDQEVVVRFRYPVRFTQGLFSLRNATLRDVVEAEGRARRLVVVDDGAAAAHPTLLDDVQRYCRVHDDALEL